MEKITLFFMAAIIVESFRSLSSMNITSACSESEDDTPPSTPKIHSNEANKSPKPYENLCYQSKRIPATVPSEIGTNMVKLDKPSTINYIELSLWTEFAVDRLQCFSYYIEVSMDRVNWTRVIDHSNYNCRSRQDLWIPPRLVQYIHIVGTNSTAGATFDIWDIGYDTKGMELVKTKKGFVVPNYGLNVASLPMGALVIDGENNVENCSVINSYYTYKEKERQDIYTYHLLESGSIVVHLAQPYILSSMRLLLWGDKNQSYSYKVEVSLNYVDWVMAIDKSNELAQSWQLLKFKAKPMLYIRITGVFSSTDKYFRCIYLEAPAQVKFITDVVKEDDSAETSAQNPIG